MATVDWTPELIKPDIWLDTADNDMVVVDGSGNVSELADKSGNEHHASQTVSTKRPALMDDELAGKPVLGFSGSAQTHLNVAGFATGVGFHMFAVARSDQSGASRHYLIDGISPGGRNVVTLNGSSQGTPPGGGRLSMWAGSWQTGVAHDQDWHILYASFVAGAGTLYRDGLLVASGAVGAGSLTNSFRIGANHLDDLDYLTGGVAEIGCLDVAAVSTDDREYWEGYLAHKWGLESKLQIGHKYKTVAPQAFEAAGNATVQGGGPVDLVRVFRWPNGELLRTATPDSSGDWAVLFPTEASIEVGVTYIAAGCQPITHGPYLFESD